MEVGDEAEEVGSGLLVLRVMMSLRDKGPVDVVWKPSLSIRFESAQVFSSTCP